MDPNDKNDVILAVTRVCLEIYWHKLTRINNVLFRTTVRKKILLDLSPHAVLIPQLPSLSHKHTQSCTPHNGKHAHHHTMANMHTITQWQTCTPSHNDNHVHHHTMAIMHTMTIMHTITQWQTCTPSHNGNHAHHHTMTIMHTITQ